MRLAQTTRTLRIQNLNVATGNTGSVIVPQYGSKGGIALGTKCSAQGGESPEKSEMDRKLDSHRAVAMDKIAV